ncbi:MAG: ABC transporter permease, partial [Terriglobales bacterium]
MALNTLREHKVRSTLTVLGIVIGITALIAVASILVGLDRDVRVFLDDFGTDTLFVFKFTPGFQTGRLSAEERMRKPLAEDDGIAIREAASAVRSVVVEVFPRFTGGPRELPSARYRGEEVFGVEQTGSWPSYEQVYNARVAQGRFFTEVENLHRSDVVVVGYDLAEGLFAHEDPIGKNILLNGVSYQVVGVLEKRKGQFFRDDSTDKVAVVPYGTYRKHHPAADEHFIGALAYPGRKAAAEDQIREILRRRRRVAHDQPDNFGISSSEQIATQFRQITGVIAL